MDNISLIAAFIGGIISFFSPCVLPLIPGMLAYLAGTHKNHEEKDRRFFTFINAIFFVLGFTVVFALIGVLLNGIFSSISFQIKDILTKIGGLFIIAFGLFMLGIIKIDYLQVNHKIRAINTNNEFLTSAIFGATFAAGWTPCVGAILGSILTLAVVNSAQALPLMLAYSFGLGIPFIITGAFSSEIMTFLKKSGWLMKHFEQIAGILLIILGILIFTDKLTALSNSLLVSFGSGISLVCSGGIPH